MSLRSILGNVTKSVGDTAGSVISATTAQINGIVGTAGVAVSSTFSGGFIGIDTNNINAVETAIIKYCDSIGTIISGFDENAQLDNAYKGKMQEGVRKYVMEVKGLLTAYVSFMKKSVEDLHAAVEAYNAGVSDLSQQVQNDADSIRQKAESIRMN